jgi:hypothetical protein
LAGSGSLVEVPSDDSLRLSTNVEFGFSSTVVAAEIFLVEVLNR